MRIIIFCLSSFLLLSCSPQQDPGPLEKAGEHVDETVATVATKSEDIAEKTVRGAKKITRTVRKSVSDAAGWVSRKVAPEEEVPAEPAETERY